MTKEKYMALADFQTLWATKLKPWINGQKADKTDVNALASAIGYTQEFVDLGLPSGTLWARCNVGATVETVYGNYYKYGNGASQYDSSQEDYEGTEEPLDPSKDTATQVLGDMWCMPTISQVDELIDNTTYSWETNFKDSGVNGAKFTAQNGNYIFIPAAGTYWNGKRSGAGTDCEIWTSTPNGSNSAHKMFALSSSDHADTTNDLRYGGLSVRAVVKKTILDLIDDKADKSELPTYATPAECRAIVTGYTPSE